MISEELSHGFLESLKEMITEKAKPGDNFWLEQRGQQISVWYSRYYSGGSYNSCCSINIYDKVIRVFLDNRGHLMTQHDLVEEFEIAAPDSFDKIVDIIIKTSNTMQLDRPRSHLSTIEKEKLEPPNVWERKDT